MQREHQILEFLFRFVSRLDTEVCVVGDAQERDLRMTSKEI